MKVLFAHDHVFYKFKDEYFSNGGLSGQVLSRYTQVFEELLIVSRQVILEELNDKLTFSSIENTTFVGVPNFKTLQGLRDIKMAEKIISKTVIECDCLIARLPSEIGNIAIKYAKRLNKPYLVEVVGCAWDGSWNHGSVIGKALAPVSYFRNRRNIRKSRYTSYITKEFLQSRYSSYGDTCILPNVDIKKVEDEVIVNRLEKIENMSRKSEIVFGLVGSLDVDYKGHKTVIKAFSLIKDKIPEFRIEFLGKGNAERWIKLAKEYGVSENTNFIGTLPSGEAVYRWMDRIDISLQPSSAEAQGRCIIEAMSRGCPVIASKVGGIVELIDHNWLISSGDYVELSNKILKLIEDKEVLKQQAIKNFGEAKHYYKQNIDNKRKLFFEEFKEYVEKANRGDQSINMF